jgi:hypothetical protein
LISVGLMACAKAAAKAAVVPKAPHVGSMPCAHVLPSQPVYSRHQLAALPPGFVSVLNPAECRPWASVVVTA